MAGALRCAWGVLRGEKKRVAQKKKGQDENHHLVNVSGWEDILWLKQTTMKKLRGSSKRICLSDE